MKSKALVTLTLACAACLQAAPYNSEWSEFDSGRGAQHGGPVTHAGVFSGWLRTPMQSAHYDSQQGYPVLPMPGQTPGAPILTITRVGNDVRVAWPDSAVDWLLLETPSLGSGASWTKVPGPYQQGGDALFLLVPASGPSRFYRLAAPSP